MRTLTPEELAKAKKLRDDRMSWIGIGHALHCSTNIVRDALVAEGYSVRIVVPEEFKALAYKRYIVDGATLRQVEIELGISTRTIKKWIIERGGRIRYGRKDEKAVSPLQMGDTWYKYCVCRLCRDEGRRERALLVCSDDCGTPGTPERLETVG